MEDFTRGDAKQRLSWHTVQANEIKSTRGIQDNQGEAEGVWVFAQ